MANEFIARKGLIVLANGATITGSLRVSGGITGSLSGTATFATSASFAQNTLAANTATSASFATTASAATSLTFIPATASFAQNALTANSATSASFASVAPWTGLTGVPVGIVSSSLQLSTFNGSHTGSYTGSYTGSLLGTASFAQNALTANNATSASFATTSSAATSITFIPATASFAQNALTANSATSASFATTASAATSITFIPATASFAQNALTANSATSASFAITASAATSLTFIPASASFAQNALTANSATSASFATTASAATSITFIPASASYATIAQAVIGGVQNANTASYVDYNAVVNKPTLVSSSAQINTGSFTGSFTGAHTGSYTGSFVGNGAGIVGLISASYALTASVALNAAAPNLIISGATSASVSPNFGLQVNNVVTASQFLGTGAGTQFVGSASFAPTDWNTINNKPTVVSSSAQISYTGITNVPVGIVSSSAQTVALIAGQAIAPATVNGIYIPALATTGSNTFTGTQIFQNIQVLGSSSIMNITSSQVNVGNNKLVLNTNDFLRYGGLSIYDSGSTSQRSGSFYWDSLRDTFVAEMVASPSLASSSLFIMGPRATTGLGNEVGLTTNTVPKASSVGIGQHIVDSQITDDGTTVVIPNTLRVGTQAQIAGALYTTGSAAVNTGTFVIAQVSNTLYDGAQFMYIVKNGSTSIRTGVVLASWIGSSVEFTDTSTADIGTTTDVEFTVDLLAGNARLKATSVSNGWTVKTIVQAI